LFTHYELSVIRLLSVFDWAIRKKRKTAQNRAVIANNNGNHFNFGNPAAMGNPLGL
jgi:hypothetical protein